MVKRLLLPMLPAHWPSTASEMRDGLLSRELVNQWEGERQMEEGRERGCMKLARLSSMFSSTPDPRRWAGRAKRGEADDYTR